MKVIKRTTENSIANVYIAEDPRGRLFEFVESTQPPFTISEKWVLIVSTLFGCPVNCSFCDAGGSYDGKLDRHQIMFQIEELIRRRFPSGRPETKKFKIQFSRMGEPSFNPEVLKVLETLHDRFDVPEFIPSLSTIAPVGTGKFFEDLLEIKKAFYNKSFQLQFSIHSTDQSQRNKWMPVRKWDFEEMAAYGRKFYHPEGKKITLNFAISTESLIDPSLIKRIFPPEIFLIKLTPVNPTTRALENNIVSAIPEDNSGHQVMEQFEVEGFEVLLSVGEREENKIGSNCGQYISSYLKTCEKDAFGDTYSYGVSDIG